MNKETNVSTTKLAKLMGISRIAVYKQIKNGKIKAQKKGRNFIIAKKELNGILDKTISHSDKSIIKKAVKKAVQDYGETLRLLGQT